MAIASKATVLAEAIQPGARAEMGPGRGLIAELQGWVPPALLVIAAALIGVSLMLPFWRMTLRTPQYPGGLHAQIFVTHVAGDIEQLNGINQYIGMRDLGTLAPLERSLAAFLIPGFALLTATAAFVGGRRWVWLVVPGLGLPLAFAADLGAWLYYAGHSLDPQAPLSAGVKPFMPPLLGEAKVGQFVTVASFGPGFYLALAAAVLIAGSIVLRRRARERR